MKHKICFVMESVNQPGETDRKCFILLCDFKSNSRGWREVHIKVKKSDLVQTS